MTRQIKELWKKANAIEAQHYAEDKLSFGMMSPEAHDYYLHLYDEVLEQIAALRGYENWNSYMFYQADMHHEAFLRRYGLAD